MEELEITINNIRENFKKGKVENGITKLLELYKNSETRETAIEIAEEYGIKNRIKSGVKVKEFKHRYKNDDIER